MTMRMRGLRRKNCRDGRGWVTGDGIPRRFMDACCPLFGGTLPTRKWGRRVAFKLHDQVRVVRGSRTAAGRSLRNDKKGLAAHSPRPRLWQENGRLQFN